MPDRITSRSRCPVTHARGFLGRLRRDERGNALAIMAAAIFPLVGMVGGAVDMSRLYLVKSRLQQACDAGVLAGRRVMVGTSVTADSNAMTQAQSFFRINLANGAYGATVNPLVVTDVREGGVPTGNLTGRVHGVATATVPMTLMRIFGNKTMDMTANCEANLNIANNDIMFVLDLTGSMGCMPNGTGPCFGTPTQTGGVWRVAESTGSKIASLRDAVSQFFTTLDGATPATARLRLGFVPYSSSINIGAVMPTGSMRTTAYGYRSREAKFTTVQQVPTTVPTSAWIDQQYNSGAAISSGDCDLYAQNRPFGSFNPSPAGNTPSTPFTTTGAATPPAASNGVEYQLKLWGPGTATTRPCTRQRRTTRTTWATRYAFAGWNYNKPNFDISSNTYSYVTLPTTPPSSAMTTTSGWYNPQQLAAMVASGTAVGMPAAITDTWDGCVEERDITDDIDGSATTPATQWRPTRRGFIHRSNGVQPWQNVSDYTCTMPSQRLAVMTQGQVDAYVRNPRFAPHGATYHDIGMIWGTRLMSLNSVFAADHSTAAPNGREVRRHIIFMTDGDMQPSLTAYTPYGVEIEDRRVSTAAVPTAASLKTLHNQRFLAACAAARSRGISIWTVAFGTGRTTELTSCADSGQDLLVDPADPMGLQKEFQKIAQRIAELRLSE